MTTKAEAALAERQEAIERLRDLCPPGTRILCTLDHASKSGMSRRISFYAVDCEAEGGDVVWLNGLIEKLGTYKRPRSGNTITHDGLRVDGAGMDMGFAVVYDVSNAVHGDGYSLKHRWL